jgi:hypothetical protein
MSAPAPEKREEQQLVRDALRAQNACLRETLGMIARPPSSWTFVDVRLLAHDALRQALELEADAAGEQRDDQRVDADTFSRGPLSEDGVQ